MRRRSVLLLGTSVVAAVVLSSCRTPSFGARDPATEQAGDVYRLWQGVTVAALVVGAIVFSALVFVLVRYRRRRDDDTIPSQRAFNLRLELGLLAVPIAIIVVLYALSSRVANDVSGLSSRPDLRVEVVGYQWSWEFRYEGTPVRILGTDTGSTGPELVLPEGRTARLRLRTTDVNHSFFVPRFLSKRDLIPRVRNEIDVRPSETGTFVGRCAEYCGLDHWRMNFRVRVLPPAEFDRWLADQRAKAQRASATTTPAGATTTPAGATTTPAGGG
ncbi:MAG: cytochrome c oxidase subunit II [Actinobacteria bacterium]|nr:cytochrome c oxidase subunit II [Actinomycetota bacterium]